ncbi:PEP-CTERM sorting domain-containing protein [Marinobacter sp. LN3S78]|uniref:PEP-CTERM sorting domain-containing protein n=1 Tax=Marinobacter sp. LN3S78 TaxID=3382300 RepID=UPI00387AD60C
MLLDTNRQGVFTPNGFGAGFNIVGSSAELLIRDIPEPAPLLLLSTGVLGVWLQRRRTPRHQKGQENVTLSQLPHRSPPNP